MSAFDLCNTKEKRFLHDLMQAAAHDRRNHPVPELHAITRAVERMWGGHHNLTAESFFPATSVDTSGVRGV